MNTESIFILNPDPNATSASTQRMDAPVPSPCPEVNLDNVKNFSNVCRTCASITEFVMPIYAGEGLQNNLADKITKHLPIQVTARDELPLVVCYQCASTLLAWHELVKCCVQADSALRAKLRSVQRKTRQILSIKSSSSIEEEADKLPEYSQCTYCPTSHPVAIYKQHLVQVHGDLLFHCEVCDLLIDRKEFIRHMSYHHTRIYNIEELIEKMKKKREAASSQNTRPVQPITAPVPLSIAREETTPPVKTLSTPKLGRTLPVKTFTPQLERTKTPIKILSIVKLDTSSTPLNKTLSTVEAERTSTSVQSLTPKVERMSPPVQTLTPKVERTSSPAQTISLPKVECTSTPVAIEDLKPLVVVKTKTSVQENEFSDHSDTDDFGPLPESVFDAIEDSQDKSTSTPSNNRISDESNKSTQSENINLKNPAQCLENNNNLTNNCSVVLEPIDINRCIESNKISQHESLNSSNAAQGLKNTNNCSVVLEPIDINSSVQNINIVIKNSNTNNNLALPSNGETSSETTDTSEKLPTHAIRNGKVRQCPFCPRQYKASSSYFYHLKYFHKGTKEHECEVCGRKFGTRSCLTQHMAVHSEQYEFECKQCQKQFKSKASLYIHEQTHSGTKSWSCSQCQTSFRWKTHLLRHMKRHAAEKAHACDACGRAFSVRCDLLRHARTHTAGTFSCDRCGQKFAQLRYLKVHLTKQHKISDRNFK